MYIGDMTGNNQQEVYLSGKMLNKLKKRWSKFKKMSGKNKWKAIGKAALIGPLAAPVVMTTALTALPMAAAAAPIVATVRGTKRLVKKNPKLQKIVKVAAMGLIPGVGPIMSTVAAGKAIAARTQQARKAAAAAEAAGEQASPQEVYTDQPQQAPMQTGPGEEGEGEEGEAESGGKKKNILPLILTAAAAGVGLLFLGKGGE